MPSLTIGGVSCTIAHADGSPGIVRRWPPSGPEVDITFQCDWQDAPNLASALLGYVKLADDGSIARVPPYNLPWATQLYCMAVSDETAMAPMGGYDGWTRYQISQITATFGALKWQVDPEDPAGRVDASGLAYTTTRFRVSAEVYSPPTGAYYIAPFGPSAEQISQGSTTLIRPSIDVNMQRHWIAKVPLAAAVALVGCVNADDITLADFNFPRGCLLFNGMESEPTNDSNGFPVFDLCFNFAGHADVEWNELMGSDGQYHLLNTASDGAGEYPFPYASFDPLFAENLA